VEDWGLRSPAIPFPLAGGGASPGDQQGGPRRTSTGPGPLSCPFRDSPQAPSAWPLDGGSVDVPPSPPLDPPATISCPASRNQRSSVPGSRDAGPTVSIRLKASALAVPVRWTLRRCIFACLGVALAAGVGLPPTSPGHARPFVHFWVDPLIIPALHPNSPSAPVLSAGFRVEDFCSLPTPHQTTPWTPRRRDHLREPRFRRRASTTTTQRLETDAHGKG